MLEGGGFQEAFKTAFPNITTEEQKIMDATAKTRDLAVRIYAEEISITSGEFDMPIGSIALMDMMKVDMGNYSTYEKAEEEEEEEEEEEIFKPMHQKSVDAGDKASGGLLRFMSPIGSATFASNMTVNMFKNVEQMLNQKINFSEGMTSEQTKMI